jgi:hypothetical protein
MDHVPGTHPRARLPQGGRTGSPGCRRTADPSAAARTDDPGPPLDLPPVASHLLVVVRRQAHERYTQLREMFDPKEAEVLWDRRVRERRRRADVPWPAGWEHRQRDRRRSPSITWTVLDFVVVHRED